MPFAIEAPLARKVLAESRTLRGTGAAGVATIGAAGVKVAQEVLAEAQTAVLPLVPYLNTLRWVFIVLALGGIAVAIWARVDDWKRGLLLSVLTIALFMLNLRRADERAGRLAKRLSTSKRTHEIQRQMLDGASSRPADRDALADSLRDGRF